MGGGVYIINKWITKKKYSDKNNEDKFIIICNS